MNEEINNVDICIVTYNRLPYLQNCIWSILASTKINYRLLIISDKSTDGTDEWLLHMKLYDKINEVLINEENLGTAKSFNKIINFSTSGWFVMACDDVYFHRGWDIASIGLINEFDDCGVATFFNNFPDKDRLKKMNDHTYWRMSSGLAASMIKKELFIKVGGFYLPDGIKMGHFSGEMCIRMRQTDLKRKEQYITIPEYAILMDVDKKMSREYLLKDYRKMRGTEKHKI